MASQLGNLQASAQSGVAAAHSEAQSDASHGNDDLIADSAASPLAAQSQVSRASAGEVQPATFAMHARTSTADNRPRHDEEPESKQC